MDVFTYLTMTLGVELTSTDNVLILGLVLEDRFGDGYLSWMQKESLSGLTINLAARIYNDIYGGNKTWREINQIDLQVLKVLQSFQMIGWWSYHAVSGMSFFLDSRRREVSGYFNYPLIRYILSDPQVDFDLIDCVARIRNERLLRLVTGILSEDESRWSALPMMIQTKLSPFLRKRRRHLSSLRGYQNLFSRVFSHGR